MTDAILFAIGLIFKHWNARSENQARNENE